MSLGMPPIGADPRPDYVCGRCNNPLPIAGGLRRCPAPPRSKDDGNLCFKKGPST